jgi:hypothetical protein
VKVFSKFSKREAITRICNEILARNCRCAAHFPPL